MFLMMLQHLRKVRVLLLLRLLAVNELEASSSSLFSGDTSTYFHKVKACNDKVDLIKNVYVPNKSYYFPKNKIGRGFRYEWLSMFPWLCYSASEDGAYTFKSELI